MHCSHSTQLNRYNNFHGNRTLRHLFVEIDIIINKEANWPDEIFIGNNFVYLSCKIVYFTVS